MKFRYTLSHAIAGNKIISEPVGWDRAVLSLERHEKFHSLLESFKSGFESYGSNGEQDGGRDFIKSIEDVYGPDADLLVLIEANDDEVNWITLFEGEVPIGLLEESLELSHLLTLAFTNQGYWTKFMSRQETPVNIQDPQDLDGNAVPVLAPIVVPLPTQKINYYGDYNWGLPTTYFPSVDFDNDGFQLDWEEVVVDDLNKNTLPRIVVEFTGPTPAAYDAIQPIFTAPEDGVYVFDIRIEHADLIEGPLRWIAGSNQMRIFIHGQGSSLQIFDDAFEDYGDDQIAISTFNGSFKLIKGQQIAIFKAGLPLDATVFGSRLNVWKPTCKVVSTVSLPLLGFPVVDGVATAFLDYILLTNQGDPSQNGMWVIDGAGWYRHPDADTMEELIDASFYISHGTEGAGSTWVQTNTDFELGVDPVTIENIADNSTRVHPYPAPRVPITYFKVTAATTFKKTSAEAFLVHDVAYSITDRIIGDSSVKFYSERLGGLLTQASAYLVNGKDWGYVLTRGLQLRQYPFSQKSFFLSFKEFFEGLDPIFNMGLGPDVVAGNTVIRMEPKDYFYDSSEMSVAYYNIKNISRSYENDLHYKAIEIGYKKWESEDVSGIDDPQTKHTYASRFKKIGSKITLFSEWIAASLAIETTRRQGRAKSQDYKYDDDVFIISVTDELKPRIDEGFTEVTGLTNSDTRYNKVITPARNFLRWRRFLSNGLQSYLTSVFKFVSGEGNYDMTSTMVNDPDTLESYGGGVLSEGGDIPVSDSQVFMPQAYKVIVPMTLNGWLAILAKRTKAIGISLKSTDAKPFLIKTIEYTIMDGQATIIAWPKDKFDINHEDKNQTPPQEYIFDDSFEHGTFE